MRYINADTVKELINNGLCTDTDADKEYACLLIDAIPTADVRKNIHGEWLDTTHGLKCSACETFQTSGSRYYKFCPICGADMRGRRN